MNDKEKLNYIFNSLIGKTIEIISMDDPYADRYIGKQGIVEKVSIDPWGDVRLDGTWGGIGIYPGKDEFKVLN